jgi:hypothetical protein
MNNIEDLCKELCVENVEDLYISIYKYTDCGAWIEIFPDRVRLGSIVEGSDFDTATYTLSFPFTIQEFNETIIAIEEEANFLWCEANEDCEEET